MAVKSSTTVLRLYLHIDYYCAVVVLLVLVVVVRVVRPNQLVKTEPFEKMKAKGTGWFPLELD